MFIARNDNGTGDENGTVATVLDAWIPEERRGRIYRARVVLYPFGPMTDVYSLLGQPFPKAGATLERPVFLTRIKGPRPQNWPGHILSSYENLDTHAGRVQLTYSSQLARPTATATFQGPFASSTRGGQQNLRLLFELGGGQAVVFRGGHRISDRPRIIFDYAPK